ncbi:MAG: putative bifunctional diguanylate cyclase/phosphodiesterase [Acidimicrobiales bacterium]
MSIRRRLVLTSAAGIVPLFAAGVLVVALARDAMRDEVRRGLASAADLEAARVADAVAAMDERLSQLASVKGIAQAVVEAQQPGGAPLELARFMTADAAGPPAVSVYGRDGRLLDAFARDDGPIRPVNARLVERGRQGAAVGAAFRVGGEFRYQHAHPIERDGAWAGVVVAECPLAGVVGVLLDNAALGETADVHVVQRLANGDAEFVTGPRFARDRQLGPPVPASAQRSPAQQALRGPDRIEEGLRDYRGKEVIAAFRQIRHTPWTLVVKVDTQEAYGSVSNMARTIMLALLVALGSATLASSLLAGSVIRRLRAVTAVASAVRNGELNRRVEDPRGDEVGRLADAFDTMTDHLVLDIRQREQSEARLAQRARFDALTDLPARWVALDFLRDALAKAGPHEVGVLFCDLDRFKTVNDELGHEIGDRVLQIVAGRLHAAAVEPDLAARYGGDEFLVICPRLAGPEALDAAADRVRRAFSTPVHVDGLELTMTISMGCAHSADPAADPATLIRHADRAMYQAKRLGRDRYVVERADASGRGLAVSGEELAAAIRADGLRLVYQPIVDLTDGAVLGYEAFVRWPHPTLGPLQPAEFLAAADHGGTAAALDRWVAGAVCRQLGEWQRDPSTAAALGGLRVALNLTDASLADPGFARLLAAEMAEQGVSPDRLCLELSERSLGQHPDHCARALGALRALGVRVAIDDYGAGCSSLERLRRLPFDVLKIDRSFVHDLGRDPAARSIADAVIRLGAALEVTIVAEGVERAEQCRVLRALGCDAAQGFYLAPPVSSARLLERGWPRRWSPLEPAAR